MTSWTESPYSVLVAASASLAGELETGARQAGASVIALNLAGAADRPALLDLLSREFMFPLAANDLDAAVDWMSDLSWFGSASGYLVRVEGLDGLRQSVVEDFSAILPAILDRWRAQRTPVVFVLVGSTHAPAALAALRATNQWLQEQGSLPWAQPGTGPVTIVDCGRSADRA